MKLKRKLLNDTSGYTLIELMIIILVFAIAIVPIYKMLTSGAKIQKSSEETYEATLQAQSLLQSVKGQIERDVGERYSTQRKVTAVGVQPWLEFPIVTPFNASLIDFLSDYRDPAGLVDPVIIAKKNQETLEFRTKYKTKDFLYEVHIWQLEDGQLKQKPSLPPPGPEPPVSFVEYDPSITPSVTVPTFTDGNTSAFTMVQINTAIKDYFGDKESFLWTNTPSGTSELKAIGEITYKNADEINITGNGIESTVTSETGSPAITVATITGYQTLDDVVKLSYEKYVDSVITHNIIIEETALPLAANDTIQFSVDLTTFDPTEVGLTNMIFRIENKTKAKVVIPVYNEKNDHGIAIYPVQHKTGGNIVVENRLKRDPSTNFVIGIIVRDAYNSTFGQPNKILSKIVDVYSYDYNKK